MPIFDSAISTPITSSAAFSYASSQEAEDIFSGKCKDKPLYSRIGNPTSSVLEKKLAVLDNALACITTSSGMSAICLPVLALCSNGDEIIAIGGLFGGSYALFDETLPRFGINTSFFSVDQLDKLEEAITLKTKIIFCESVGNPNMRLPDLARISNIATKHQIVLVVDNTLTPLIVKPFDYGADVVVYSTTKIISGNSSALGGAVIVRDATKSLKLRTEKYIFLAPFLDKMGPMALFGCMKKWVLRDFGMSANAFASYQTLLGLETLEIRSSRINSSCEIIALALNKYNINVNHPSLDDNIDNELYKAQFPNGCGTMITIDMATKEKAFKFLDNTKHLTITANLGDTRTLGLHMASTIYRDFTPEVNKSLGITNGLIRISIGLEDPTTIINDLKQAFDHANS